MARQQRLFYRNCPSEDNDLLSVLLICRILAMPGDWHHRIKPDFLAVTYVHSGETQVRINDFSFTAEAGDLLLMPPGSDYELRTTRKAVRSGLIIQGSLPGLILQKLRNRYVFSDNEQRGFAEKIEQFFRNAELDEHRLSVLTFDLLSSLNSFDATRQLPEVLQKVLQKMKKHLDHVLVLDDLAKEAGVSARTLGRIFQKHLQISPHQYLLRMRMRRACQMLSCEDFSIKEIAISVGYPNALNFSTEFRRLLGCSPSVYRTRKNRPPLPQPLDLLPDLPGEQKDYRL